MVGENTLDMARRRRQAWVKGGRASERKWQPTTPSAPPADVKSL
jgi:hypothetical protein